MPLSPEENERLQTERSSASIEPIFREAGQGQKTSDSTLAEPDATARRAAAEMSETTHASHSIPERAFQQSDKGALPAHREHVEADRETKLNLDLDKAKLGVQKTWLRGKGEWPVKVIANRNDIRPSVEGYFTQLKYVCGKTPVELEHQLGLHPGELKEGAAIMELKTIPRTDEFHLRGYTNVAGEAAYPPGAGVTQWELGEGVKIKASVLARLEGGQKLFLTPEQAYGRSETHRPNPNLIRPEQPPKNGEDILKLESVHDFIGSDLNLKPMSVADHKALRDKAGWCKDQANKYHKHSDQTIKTLQHEKLLIKHCADPANPNEISLELLHNLADDLQTASIYLETLTLPK